MLKVADKFDEDNLDALIAAGIWKKRPPVARDRDGNPLRMIQMEGPPKSMSSPFRRGMLQMHANEFLEHTGDAHSE